MYCDSATSYISSFIFFVYPNHGIVKMRMNIKCQRMTLDVNFYIKNPMVSQRDDFRLYVIFNSICHEKVVCKHISSPSGVSNPRC